MNTTAVSVWHWVQTAGLTALLLVILYGGRKRVWVWGYLYEEVKTELDHWRACALRGSGRDGSPERRA